MDIITRITRDVRSTTVRFQIQLSMYQSINTMFKNGKRQKKNILNKKHTIVFNLDLPKGAEWMIKGCLLHHPLDPNRTPWKMLEPVQDPFFWKNLYRWWFQLFFIFTPIWGKISNLTNIFQRGWNRQPVINLHRNFRVKVSERPNLQVGGPKEVYACGECGVSWPGNVPLYGCMVCLPTFGWLLWGKWR